VSVIHANRDNINTFCGLLISQAESTRKFIDSSCRTCIRLMADELRNLNPIGVKMGRKYAACYDKDGINAFSIIAKDEDDELWFVYIPDAGTEDTAKTTANALNKSAQD